MKIKGIIEQKEKILIIDNHNNIYTCKSICESSMQLMNTTNLYQYYIKKNVLYHKWGLKKIKEEEVSLYNPIRKLTQKEITPLLQDII